MGLFDRVKCDVELPGNPPEWVREEAIQGKLQTKDFDCLGDTYIITADGCLIRNEIRSLRIPREMRQYWRKPELELQGVQDDNKFQRIIVKTEEVNYNGLLRFYTYSMETREFYEYTAKFNNGKLEGIVQTK